MSHELRNPLSAIVQSSDVVMNSLRGMLSLEISSAASHEISDDIETMNSIALCTMHMRRLIDDTINVRPFNYNADLLGVQAREWNAAGYASRLQSDYNC